MDHCQGKSFGFRNKSVARDSVSHQRPLLPQLRESSYRLVARDSVSHQRPPFLRLRRVELQTCSARLRLASKTAFSSTQESRATEPLPTPIVLACSTFRAILPNSQPIRHLQNSRSCTKESFPALRHCGLDDRNFRVARNLHPA